MMMVSRRKRILTRVIFPIAGLIGGTTSISALHPTETVRIVTFNVNVSTTPGTQVELLGQEVASTYGTGADVEVGIIHTEDIPKAITDFQTIFANDKSNKPVTKEVAIDRLKELYQEEGTLLVLKLVGKNIFAFVVGYGTIVSGAYGIKFLSDNKNKSITIDSDLKKKILKKAMLGVGVGTVMGVLTQAGSFVPLAFDDDISVKIEQVVSTPVENIKTGTSNVVINFEVITKEINKYLENFSRIDKAIRDTASEVLPDDYYDNEITILISSDSHNNPAVPTFMQYLMRASNADASFDLGDKLNTGEQPEIDALWNMDVIGTKFRAYDSINSCLRYNQDFKCIKNGERFPQFDLTGNHDTHDLMEILESHGIKDLSKEQPEGMPKTFALSDTCYVDETICRGDYHQDNKKYAEAQLEIFKSKYSGDNAVNAPKIGFFASKDAAEVFAGTFDFIIYGGDHKFSSYVKNGTRFISVGSIGAAGPRNTIKDKSNAAILTIKTKGPESNIDDTMSQPVPQEIDIDCISATWDPIKLDKQSVVPCY